MKLRTLTAMGLEGLVWLTVVVCLWRLATLPVLDAAGLGDAEPQLGEGKPDAAAVLERLIAAAPFGAVPTQAAVAHSDTEALQLAGVMLAENPADSRAIVRLASGEQRAFGVGDALVDGRTVGQVTAEAVHLVGPGGESVLPLHPRETDPPSTAPVAATPTPLPKPVAPVPRGLTIDKRDHASSREFLAKLRADAARDPGVLADLINIEPGQGPDGAGLRIYSRNREAMLARAGLESGDLVTEVNGVKLDGPLAGLAAAEALASADELTVKLIRNGSPITLKLRLGQPDQ